MQQTGRKYHCHNLYQGVVTGEDRQHLPKKVGANLVFALIPASSKKQGRTLCSPLHLNTRLLFRLSILHPFLRLLNKRHQSLHFGFRRLEKLLYFLSGKILFNELTDIEFFKPAVQNLKTGISFLAAAAIGKTEVMPENPAVPLPVIKNRNLGFGHLFFQHT